MPTGKLIKVQKRDRDFALAEYQGYDIFAKDKSDITFKEGDYDYEHHSVQLLMESDATFCMRRVKEANARKAEAERKAKLQDQSSSLITTDDRAGAVEGSNGDKEDK
jgi:hypothetical protein